MTTSNLLKKKEKIDQAKQEQAEIKGKIGSIEDQMSAKFKVETADAAEKELKKRASELDNMEAELEAGEEELEKAYNWND